MRRAPLIYTTTIVVILAGLSWMGLSLLQTALPSADVGAAFEADHPRFLVSAMTPGEPVRIVRQGIPIVMWRRNEAEMALAAEQDDPAQWVSPHSRITGKPNLQPAHDANLTIDHEWFFVNAIDLGGLGCVVRPQEGDYGGFFDPCRGAHFDLAGRIRKGPSTKNLQVISARLGPDGTYFELDLTNVTRGRRF